MANTAVRRASKLTRSVECDFKELEDVLVRSLEQCAIDSDTEPDTDTTVADDQPHIKTKEKHRPTPLEFAAALQDAVPGDHEIRVWNERLFWCDLTAVLGIKRRATFKRKHLPNWTPHRERILGTGRPQILLTVEETRMVIGVAVSRCKFAWTHQLAFLPFTDERKAKQVPFYHREVTIMTELSKCFASFSPQLEKVVGKYRVDMFFPTERVVIECDQDGHRGYDVAAEYIREAVIAAELDCVFYRFNPDDKGWEFSHTVNDIMRVLLQRSGS